jgi:hypothetical protein
MKSRVLANSFQSYSFTFSYLRSFAKDIPRNGPAISISHDFRCVLDSGKQRFLVFYNADILRIYRKPVFAGLRLVVYDIALPCAKVEADSSLDGIGNIFSRLL